MSESYLEITSIHFETTISVIVSFIDKNQEVEVKSDSFWILSSLKNNFCAINCAPLCQKGNNKKENNRSRSIKLKTDKTMKKLNETRSPLKRTPDKKFLDLTQKHNL